MTKDIAERVRDYAKDYTTTTYHDDLICEAAAEIESLRKKLDAKDVEIERLKTVPMRYRRMAFNAQLQDENDSLSKLLAAKQAEVDALMLEYCPSEMSQEQLANWAAHQCPAKEQLK